MSCVHRNAGRMALLIDMHLPVIYFSVDKGTTPSTSTCRVWSRSLHNLSLGTRNTARPLSHFRPRYWNKRVGIRSHLDILKKKPAHAERATAKHKPAAAGNHCSRISDERTAFEEPYQKLSIYINAGIPRDRKNWLAHLRRLGTHTGSRSNQKGKHFTRT